jgi:thiamine pyrophosphate-dependent enzyme
VRIALGKRGQPSSRCAEKELTCQGSDLLVTALENEDVDRIFGIPGEENLDVVESLRGSRIELVITRHEQAASWPPRLVARRLLHVQFPRPCRQVMS